MDQSEDPLFPLDPTPADIAALNADVRAFVDASLAEVADAPFIRYFRRFPREKPLGFQLQVQSHSFVAIDHIYIECRRWQGKGIFTGLWRYLESKPQLKRIAVDRANTEDIQRRMRRLGVPQVANAFILDRS